VSTVQEGQFMVNSLHGQGVNRLASSLRVEATALDGIVEAFTWAADDGQPAGFSLCMQWHPEWLAADNPVSRRVFASFGDACRAYFARKAESRQAPRPEPVTSS
jgi:putative glutamine amidotransferase